jgi:peroxiredoxin Q/BCP
MTLRRHRSRLALHSTTLAALVGLAACAHHAGELLSPGSPAPDFAVTAHDGQRVALAELRGRYVALYFYPKDDTPGCTKEACGFRDAAKPLEEAGVVVLGVSEQDAASHVAFAEKYHLPFPLLPDERGEIAAAYHVPVTVGFAKRVTYLIGKDGRIERVWPSVTPTGHAQEILAAVGHP